MKLPAWLSRLSPFHHDHDEGDEELREISASLDQSEHRMTEGERRIIEALGVHADVWKRRHD